MARLRGGQREAAVKAAANLAAGSATDMSEGSEESEEEDDREARRAAHRALDSGTKRQTRSAAATAQKARPAKAPHSAPATMTRSMSAPKDTSRKRAREGGAAQGGRGGREQAEDEEEEGEGEEEQEQDDDDEVMDTGTKPHNTRSRQASQHHGHQLRSLRGNGSSDSSPSSEGEEEGEEGDEEQEGDEDDENAVGDEEENEGGQPPRKMTRQSARAMANGSGGKAEGRKGSGTSNMSKAKSTSKKGDRGVVMDVELEEGRAVRQLRDRSKLVPISEQRRRRQEEEEEEAERRRRRIRQASGGAERRLQGSGGSGHGISRVPPLVPKRSAGWSRGAADDGWGRSDDDLLDAAEEGGMPGSDVWAPHPLIPSTPMQQPFGNAMTRMPGSAIRNLGGLGAPAWGGGGLFGADAGGLSGAGGPAMLGKEQKAGNAEITPLQVDPSIDFNQVGGLNHYVRALKEMVFLPLLYPELFERFKVQPPRGVLFYGPPGTGKTLVARALAAQASAGAGEHVAFFMRKGADVLSKWVGEAERQLRLLFEEAARHAPSIIFFDEIDGLAPVRSSKQDQIHNSIVSTLLALMDGLDARGKVVVIGATNRVDAIDGALRRPGRFDRELLFPLPNLKARKTILDIHTSQWSQPPSPALKQELAAHCAGYCGADLKALCAEAALAALRRRYPQIYDSNQRLLVDPASVTVERQDFFAAAASITPSSHRSAAAHAQPLSPVSAPCLGPPLSALLSSLSTTFPPAATCLAAASQEAQEAQGATSGTPGHIGSTNTLVTGHDPSHAAPTPAAAPAAAAAAQQQPQAAPSSSSAGPPAGPADSSSHAQGLHSNDDGAVMPVPAMPPPPPTSLLLPGRRAAGHCLLRPRLLLCGPEGAGAPALAGALLSALEGLPVHGVGLPALLSDPGARSLEEALVHVVVEARRAAPAILYLPHIQLWWSTAPRPLRAVLVMLLEDLPPDTPLLLVATANAPITELDQELLDLFSPLDGGQVVELSTPPPAHARKALLQPLLREAALPPPPPPASIGGDGSGADGGHSGGGGGDGHAAREELPVDLAAVAARQEEEEMRQALLVRHRYEADQEALRALRMGLRDVTIRLLSDRRWRDFAMPVDPEEDPEYYQTVSCPCDLATILAHVDSKHYHTAAAYLAHVALIGKGWQEYFAADEQQNGEQPAAAPPPPPAAPTTAGPRSASMPPPNQQLHQPTDSPPAPTAPSTHPHTHPTHDADNTTPDTTPRAPGSAPPAPSHEHAHAHAHARMHGASTSRAATAGPDSRAGSEAPVAGGAHFPPGFVQPPSAGTLTQPHPGSVQPPPLPQVAAPPPRLVSKAAALYDEAEALVKVRLPLQLIQACEAIAAKGGPAPPPPGVQSPEEIANAAMEAAAAAAGEQRRNEAATRNSHGEAAVDLTCHGRHSSRLRGRALPEHMVFEDPEIILRRSKQLMRPCKGKGGGSSTRECSREVDAAAHAGETGHAGHAGAAEEGRDTPEAEGEREREEHGRGEKVGEQEGARDVQDGGSSPSPGGGTLSVGPQAGDGHAADGEARWGVAHRRAGVVVGGTDEGRLHAQQPQLPLSCVPCVDAAVPAANGPTQVQQQPLQAVSQGAPHLVDTAAAAAGTSATARHSNSSAAGGGPSCSDAPTASRLAAEHTPQQQQQQQQQLCVGAQRASEKGAAPQHPVSTSPPEPEPRALARSMQLLEQLVQATEGWFLGPLEVLHTQVARAVVSHACLPSRIEAVEGVGRAALQHVHSIHSLQAAKQ